MPAQPNRFDKHARKVLALVWVVALIAGVALLEWMLTPGGGRHRSSAHSAGPRLPGISSCASGGATPTTPSHV
jgi:hypothetical protein